jgi:uncharacterized membrane protein HdeD (DUF308 family)
LRKPNFEEPEQSRPNKFFKIYSIVAALIFLGAGVFILLSPGFFSGLTTNQSTGFGVLLVMYGIFRLYKAFRTRVKD